LIVDPIFRLKAEATRRVEAISPPEGGRHARSQVMEKDVICGMQVDPAKAAGKSEYNGKTYYFCSKMCKTKFDANPSQYAK
jgi:YHS domain-containing protein